MILDNTDLSQSLKELLAVRNQLYSPFFSILPILY